MPEKTPDQLLEESQRTLRRVTGILGLALPLILVLWGFYFLGWFRYQGSISAYYDLRTRDAFVGILFAIGWVLYAYRGYNRIDYWAGKAAWIFALGVAFFPTSAPGWQHVVHFVSASLLFFTLAMFSLVLFTKTKESPKDLKGTVKSLSFSVSMSDNPQKNKRNIVYVVCGWTMLAALLLAALASIFWNKPDTGHHFTFFMLMEWIMIWAFSISWLVKGETVFRDRK